MTFRYWMTTGYLPWMPPVVQTPQQGWQCPICEAVYAPWVVKCDSCGEGKNPEMSAEQ